MRPQGPGGGGSVTRVKRALLCPESGPWHGFVCARVRGGWRPGTGRSQVGGPVSRSSRESRGTDRPSSTSSSVVVEPEGSRSPGVLVSTGPETPTSPRLALWGRPTVSEVMTPKVRHHREVTSGWTSGPPSPGGGSHRQDSSRPCPGGDVRSGVSPGGGGGTGEEGSPNRRRRPDHNEGVSVVGGHSGGGHR